MVTNPLQTQCALTLFYFSTGLTNCERGALHEAQAGCLLITRIIVAGWHACATPQTQRPTILMSPEASRVEGMWGSGVIQGMWCD